MGNERRPGLLSDQEAEQIGIQSAQQEMQKRGGPKVGEVVAHPSDRIVYSFKKAEGEIAFVFIPANCTADGMEIEKQFPLDELFNPNDAMRLSEEAKIESQMRTNLN